MRGISIWDPKAHKIIQLYIGKDVENFDTFARTQYQASPVPLTEREWETLKLLAAGHSNQSIANELVIAVGTVKSHVSHMLALWQLELLRRRVPHSLSGGQKRLLQIGAAMAGSPVTLRLGLDLLMLVALSILIGWVVGRKMDWRQV